MGISSGTSEITESMEDLVTAQLREGPRLAKIKTKMDETAEQKLQNAFEDDLDQLIETFDLRNSSRASGPRSASIDLLRRSAMKKPMRAGVPLGSGIGLSESVTLKQDLRKLCISQASESAAMKRLLKPIGIPSASEAGTIRKLYAAVVVETSELGKKEKEKLLEISFTTEKHTPLSSDDRSKSPKMPAKELLRKFAVSAPTTPVAKLDKAIKPKVRDIIAPSSPEVERKSSPKAEKRLKSKVKPSLSHSSIHADSNKLNNIPHLDKPAVRNKNFHKKAGIPDSNCKLESPKKCHGRERDTTTPFRTRPCHNKDVVILSTFGGPKLNVESSPCVKDSFAANAKAHSTPPSLAGGNLIVKKWRENVGCKDKGECSQSSKSSIGDYSSSTSISGESSQSAYSGVGSRPHMSNDMRWTAIRDVEVRYGSIGLKNFKLIKRLGCGDIGTVYLAELIGSDCYFALKVMDNDFLISRKKMIRAQTEREILQMLDHPFLPTLYTHFITDNLSCLVMEYCPGGDLHVLRQKQPTRNFSEPAARFYMAEVLLALEYLHMLGVVYRDLKPENILVREDGHIMLSDFDLSLRCSVNPMLLRLSNVGAVEASSRPSGLCTGSGCMDPLCLHSSWQSSCFTPRLISSNAAKNRKLRSNISTWNNSLPQLVVEPIDARSNSFVGTHEYLAPEIIKGEGHGSSVDWWTFGIFLYELLYGRTPFKGSVNEETLANVISQNLKFPDNPAIGFRARDLIRGLLVKEPENRLGSLRGAAEIKQHPFFEGLNWALIRCATPPETPKPYDFVVTTAADSKKNEGKTGKCMEFKASEEVEFELF